MRPPVSDEWKTLKCAKSYNNMLQNPAMQDWDIALIKNQLLFTLCQFLSRQNNRPKILALILSARKDTKSAQNDKNDTDEAMFLEAHATMNNDNSCSATTAHTISTASVQ